MKKFFLVILAFASVLNAQVNLSISVRTPTPPTISDWQNDPTIIQIFLTNTSSSEYQSAYFSMNIYDAGGTLVAYSKEDEPLAPKITVPAGPPTGSGTLIVNGSDIIDINAVHYDPSIQDIIISTNALPEGDYDLCLKLFDGEGNNITNGEETCTQFSIRLPDPPQLVNPMDGDSLVTEYPNFAWTPVIGAQPGYSINYVFKICPILTGQTPEMAMDANIPVVERELAAPLYVYQPSDPPFSDYNNIVGFAWQVQALYDNGMPAAKNNGKSETATFTIVQTHFNFGFTTDPPKLNKPDDLTEVTTKTPTFSWSYTPIPNEDAHYRLVVVPLDMFQMPSDGIENNPPIYTKVYETVPWIFFPTPVINFVGNKDYAWQVQVREKGTEKILRASKVRTFKYKHYGPAMAHVSGKLLYEYADPGEWSGKPLRNASFRLVKKYTLRYSSHFNNMNVGNYSQSGEIVLPDDFAWQLGMDDVGEVVAIVTTDAEGNFNFSFMAFDSSDVVVKRNVNYYAHYSNAGEFKDQYIGDVYREYKIVLDNQYLPYYLNPTENIVVQPDETVDVGNIFAYVRSYKLTITVKPTDLVGQQFTHEPIPNMVVYLMRKSRPSLVPEDEAKPNPLTYETKFGMEVVAKATTGGWGDNKGKVTFTHLVRNAGTNDKYFYWAESDPEAGKENYKLLSVGYFSYKFNDDEAFYNNQYKYPEVETDIYAVPKLPEVAGKVLRGDSGQPLFGAYVELLKFALFFWADEAHWHTYNDGYFKFSGLMPHFNNSYIIDGPIRALRISKYGYITKKLVVEGRGLNSSLLLGEKWHDFSIALEPASSIVGRVVNGEGAGVKAKVTVVGGETVDTKEGGMNWNTFTYEPSSFEVRAPSGIQTVIIDPTPFEPQYFKDTVMVNVVGNPTEAGTIVLQRKSHKLRIKAYQVSVGNGLVIPGSEKPVKNAFVRLETADGNLIEEKNANFSGVAEFDFINAGNQFVVTVKSPSTLLDLETKVVAVTVPESKGWTEKNIYLPKAAKISGHVFVGKNNNPVSNARVYLTASQSNGEVLETYTKQDGSFVLHNVPVGNFQTFAAAKSQSNTIGDYITMNVTEAGKSDVNFHLRVYEDMDITHLLGFPIEVTSLTESGGVKISGNFVKLDSLKNPLFSSVTTTIGFSNVEIVPGSKTNFMFGKNVPIAVPKSLPLKTNINSIQIKAFDKFTCSLTDKNLGIELLGGHSDDGVLSGKVFVGEGNFNVPSDNFNLKDDGFFLKQPESANLKLPAITSTMDAPFSAAKGIPAIDSNMKGIKFKLFSYDAEAAKDSSFLTQNALILNTVIHTALDKVTPADIAMKIGDVKIEKSQIAPIMSDKRKIEMNLDQWKIEGTKWLLNGYLTILEGTLKTNAVDVPIKSLNIEPTKLSGGQFNMREMSLPGGVPLNITGNPVLNYNAAEDYWFLFIGKGNADYSSYLSGLPGMEQGGKILIDAITLTSKGKKYFSPVYGQGVVKIYKVGLLSANAIEAFDDYVEISGLRFDIPGFSQNTGIRYGKDKSGNLALKIVPLGISLQAKGVQMMFGFNEEDAATQKLDDFGFVARGKVFEQGKFTLDSWLYHTIDSTSIWVETEPKQSLPIGGNSTYLANVTGSMKVSGDEWTNFRFAGDMTGTKGVTDDHKRMEFIVKGEISASGQEMGIKNIDTPFGNMSWTYEFENSRLIGTLEFHQDVGGVHIDGQAESLVDPDGWYIIAGGKMQLPGLGPAQAAILVGDYPRMTQSVRDRFAASSYKKGLPASFETKISGFLFSGAIAIPVIIPDIELNLIVLYGKLGIHAGGDARLWMSFDEDGNEYGVGLMAFVHAFVVSSSLSCTEVSADAKVELGAEGSYQTNTGIFSVDGCGSFDFSVRVIQKVPVPPADCEVIFDEGIDFSVKTLLHLDSDGNKSLKFSLGTCSGN